MTDVSVPVVNVLKNTTLLSVSVPINLSIKLVFVSVNGPVDMLRMIAEEL